MAVTYQVVSTIIISYMCMTLGLMFTWPSSTYKLFSSTNTTLERPMTGTELSLLGSLSSISAFIITPFTGYVLDFLGRKRSFIVFSLIQVLSWVIVVLSNKVEAILASIFLTGLTGCTIIIIPMYVGEICQESIRGSMTSLSMSFFAIGSLSSYCFGGFLEYKLMNYVCLSLTILGVVMLTFVKESPLFLMKIGSEKEAARSLAFYRGLKVNSKDVLQELENIRKTLNPVLDVSYMCMTLGLMFTWPSSTYKLFSSTNTTLERPMTGTELSLLGSLSSISAFIITPFTGYVLDFLGRKRSFIVFSLIQVLSWVIVVLSNKVEAILASIFLTGLTGCTIIIIPMYVGEICQESIRGSMTSLSMSFFAIGSLSSYCFGGFLEYKLMNYVCLSLTILGVVMLTFVKESPLFLMKIGSEKEAARSLAFYRGLKVNSKDVLQELENIRKTLNPVLDDATPEEECLKPEFKPNKKVSKWTFLKKSRSTRQALFVTLMMYTTVIFQGLIVVQVYAEPLLSEAIPNMSATWSAILFAIISAIASFIGAYLVDRIGRRPLIIYSSLASGVTCAILGTQIHLQWGPHWLTAVFMYLYCVSYCSGAGIVPYVIVSEVFLPEIKALASMVAMEWANICYFVVLFIFNPIVTALGLGPVFYIFAVACFLTALFCSVYVPETKGLPFTAIQELFTKKPRK